MKKRAAIIHKAHRDPGLQATGAAIGKTYGTEHDESGVYTPIYGERPLQEGELRGLGGGQASSSQTHLPEVPFTVRHGLLNPAASHIKLAPL